MSSDALNLIMRAMDELGLPYVFMERVTDAGSVFPATYFVGEYQEMESEKESGEEEGIFMLTGFTRESWSRLEQAKKEIKKYFPGIGGRVERLGSGTVAVFYENSIPIPVEDEELKKIQINLKVKEWKVEA